MEIFSKLFCVCFLLLPFGVVPEKVLTEKPTIEKEHAQHIPQDIVKLKNHDHEVEEGMELAHALVKDKQHTSHSLGMVHAFVASLSVIIVSELGDKTFFIAAILAMRHSRVTIFLGAIAALAVMTLLSAFLGFATTIIPRKLTYYVSSALFAVFGVRMLKEGMNMSPDEGLEEYEEAQAEIKKKEEELLASTADVETGVMRRHLPWYQRLLPFLSAVFLEAFVLTFLAEWGDRSQIATIILAARENVVGVIVGGVLGHSLCTGLAVVGGRMIAQKISVRTVTLVGGVVFLLFALSALIIGP